MTQPWLVAQFAPHGIERRGQAVRAVEAEPDRQHQGGIQLSGAGEEGEGTLRFRPAMRVDPGHDAVALARPHRGVQVEGR